MKFPELSLDQRRVLIDAQQKYMAWREADRAFRASNKGSMAWKKSGGKEYLYRIDGKVQRSLGARSAETEKLKAEYMGSRTANRSRVTKMRNAIKTAAKLYRAMGLARVPQVAADVLRALDRDGLLGNGIFVVGTHALFAYEARSGVIVSPELLATTDLDLLADSRSRLVLSLDEKKRNGVLACLHKVDKSFAVQRDQFRAVNDSGYFVDFIRPMRKNEVFAKDVDLGGVVPAAIDGLQWLASAPRFDAVAIAEDGEPVYISCLDPRAFALHKLWVSKQLMREPLKKRRDAAQAEAVAEIAELLGLTFNRRDLSALPSSLLAELPKLRHGAHNSM